MTGVAIVAIPSQDDYVWKLSSEKVPHMTLLFLGDITPGPELARIESFLSHVVSTSMNRFGMSVDYRGTLGPDLADVLFFRKTYSKMIETARTEMLANPDIRQAYLSTKQFPEWTPHLTLGYPATPAHPDDRDYPGIQWVNFDKIALWVGDFEGPEFKLEDQEDSVLSMGQSFVDDFFAHHGIKGMKWGVIRKNYNELRTAPRKSVSVIAKNGDTVTATERQMPRLGAGIGAISPGYRKLLNKSTLLDMNVGDRRVGDVAIHEKSKDEVNFGWIGVKPKERGKGYASAVFEAGVEHARQGGYKKISLEVPGNAPDAHHIYTKFGFKPTGETIGGKGDYWDGLTVMSYDIPKTAAAKHSAMDDDLELEKAFEQHFGQMQLDDHIFGETMQQSEKLTESILKEHGTQVIKPAVDSIDDFLAHHGIKGMKWGVRRAERSSSEVTIKTNPSKSKRVKTVGGKGHDVHPDAAVALRGKQKAKASGVHTLSNEELKKTVERMNLEQQLKRLNSPNKTEAHRFVENQLKQVGQQKISTLAKSSK